MSEEDNKEKLEAVVTRLEQANAKQEELLEREEELRAKKLLGGESEAGTPIETKEETNGDYTNKVMGNE